MGRVAVGNFTDFFAGGGIENRKCLFSVGYPFSIDIHAPPLLPVSLEAISKKSFGPNSLLVPRFKSSKYGRIPPV
jgi:hypothetical protein